MATPTEDKFTELSAPSGWLSQLDVRELWHYRELAWFLALRDLKLRYRQTVFGIAWAVLQPLLTIALFTLIFARVSVLSTNHIPYVVFAFAGILVWTYVSTSVEAGARSLVEDRALVERVYFPRLLAPLAAALPGVPDLGLSLIIFVIFLIIFGVEVPATAVLAPVWVIASVVVAIGAGFWLSALNVQYRDVRYALAFGIQVWFYATPVVYPASLIPGAWRWLYALNPLVGIIDGFRWSVLAAPSPPAADLVSVLSAAAILATGLVYFQAVQRRFADVI